MDQYCKMNREELLESRMKQILEDNKPKQEPSPSSESHQEEKHSDLKTLHL